MISANSVIKRFGDIVSVNNISLDIKDGRVFGLIGTNGAGKSTFLRMAAGVYKPDYGEIYIDDEPVFENSDIKKKIFYISDEQFFYPNATGMYMAEYYKNYYSNFSMEKFVELLQDFGLDGERRIRTFSKGMKKQMSVILAMSANTEYIFMDETFDGLDPVMRQAVKSIIASNMTERKLTVIIASHNLRELEDVCDDIGLMHKGGILLSDELDSLKLRTHKCQIVLREEDENRLSLNTVLKNVGLELMNINERGRLKTITVRGDRDEIENTLLNLNPQFMEMIPLTLEEIFISETEVVGYEFKNLIY